MKLKCSILKSVLCSRGRAYLEVFEVGAGKENLYKRLPEVRPFLEGAESR